MLDQLLQTYLGSSECDVVRGPATCRYQEPADLPSSIQLWPRDWRHRFDTVASTITRVLPIDALHAEAAAEIAVRCEYSLQNSREQVS